MPTEREYFEEIREQTFSKARLDRLEIILPSPNQIQLDIDRPWSGEKSRLETYSEVSLIIHNRDKRKRQVLDRLLQEMAPVRWEAWKSNGGNSHVQITFWRTFEPLEKVTLQAILGSDSMRELLNFRRVLCGADDPIALFCPPGRKLVALNQTL